MMNDRQVAHGKTMFILESAIVVVDDGMAFGNALLPDGLRFRVMAFMFTLFTGKGACF